MQHGYDAFVATLAEPLEGPDGPLGRHSDVLLFEVGRWRAESGPSGLFVNLDRRISHRRPAGPEILKIGWYFGEDQELAEHDGYDILGRGPGLSAKEDTVPLESFLSEVDASPVLARMRGVTPVRTRVWIESPE